jgi:peptide/nickel transport system ATP-binding protein
MAALLEINGLSVDFLTPRGRVQALRDVDLSVPQGEVVGLVGESGCGKTTLVSAVMNLLAGNADIRSGRILFDGRDILKLNEGELRRLRGERIAMVFQDPMTALNPVLPIATQAIDIQYRGRADRSEKRARAIRMLRRVGIPDAERRIDRYPHEFSGGMRQRICIALALIANPDLLIADEPTTALDVTLEAQIIHLLRELKDEVRGSILFVSHHLGLVAELCDRVTVMYAGEVVETGTVHDVFHRPQHPYTQALLLCDPARIEAATRELPTIEGEVPSLIHLPHGCVFRPRCPHAFERCTEHPPLYGSKDGYRAARYLSQAGSSEDGYRAARYLSPGDHAARCHLLDHG